MEQPTYSQTTPTADQRDLLELAIRRSTEARKKFAMTQAAAQEAYDRTVNPVRAELDAAVGELRALTDALREAA